MPSERRKPKQSASIFSIAVMVGAVGLTLAGSSLGGLSATTGFFLAFAATFLLVWVAWLFAGRTRGLRSEDEEAPGQETQAVPRSPITPAGQSGNVLQDKPWASQNPSKRGRADDHTDEL
jgi:hypothetical protein